jgi:hypothetical protein
MKSVLSQSLKVNVAIEKKIKYFGGSCLLKDVNAFIVRVAFILYSPGSLIQIVK